MGAAEPDWADMMMVEGEGDAVQGPAAVLRQRPVKTADDTAPPPPKASAPKERMVPPQPDRPVRPMEAEPPVRRSGGGVQQFLDAYQWAVLAAALAVWTWAFYLEMGAMRRVVRDRLWWVGVLLLGMVLSLSFRTRAAGTLSAYSICNEGTVAIPGGMNTDAMLGLTRAQGGGGSGAAAPPAAGVDAALLARLENERFARNDDCPCGSGAKFKACCAATQQRLRAAKAPGRI